MRTPPSIATAVILAAAFVVGACGGDDDKTTSSSADKTPTKTQATTKSGAPATGPASRLSSNPEVKAADKCFRAKGSVVVFNPGSQFGAEYQLVVGGGTVGIVYGYKDAAAARANEAKVLKYEETSDRKTEVVGTRVIAYSKPGSSMAKPGAVDTLHECIR